jgi:hypothetical protein
VGATFPGWGREGKPGAGPNTEEGKRHARANAVRHGLTAKTVIGSLEDADDYKAFEAAVASDYRAETAVERELVLRLASLLWRLRRTTLLKLTSLISKQRFCGFAAPQIRCVVRPRASTTWNR